MTRTLHYVADPMCSWCWGFAPEWAAIRAAMPSDVETRMVMGGLAPDSDEPMTEEVRAYVQNAWREVTARTGATFNWDFWTECQPRRSTWPACRAVLAARHLDAALESRMFEVIQRAYYLEARNPSDVEVHVALAGEIGLDAGKFAARLRSGKIEAELQGEFVLRRELGVRTFPSLVLRDGDSSRVVLRGHGRAGDVLASL